MQQKINEVGRTMLEMIGVLAVMGLIIYGAVVGIGFGVDMYKVTATYSDLEEIAQTVTDLYSWGSGYPTGVSDIGSVICRKNLAPMACASKLPSRWAEGDLSVSAPEEGYFVIKLSGIPRAACSRLAKMDYQNTCVKKSGQGVSTQCEDSTRNLVLVSFGSYNNGNNDTTDWCDEAE